jgi:imidazolonepropionase-like amidohydrolase
VDDEFIQMVKERGVIYTTTLVVFEGYDKVFAQQATLTDMDQTCGDPRVSATWADLAKMGYPPRSLSGGSQELQIASANLKRMQEAGVIIAAGTDAGNIGTLHGPAIHREFELMAAAGLTPSEILVAATRNAARVFRSSPEMGTIEPGKLADLVILDADPTGDIRNARKINQVIKGGRVFEHGVLVAGFGK